MHPFCAAILAFFASILGLKPFVPIENGISPVGPPVQPLQTEHSFYPTDTEVFSHPIFDLDESEDDSENKEGSPTFNVDQKDQSTAGSSDATLIDIGEKATNELWKLVQDPSGWQKKSSDKTYTIWFRPGKENNVWKSDAIFAASPRTLFELLYTNLESSVTWDSDVAQAQVLYRVPSTDETIISRTDIVRKTSKPKKALVTTIQGREFISVRHWDIRLDDNIKALVISDMGLDDTVLYPESKTEEQGFVRGFSHGGGVVILPNGEGGMEASESRLLWVINSDVHLSKHLVNLGMSNAIKEYIEAIRSALR